MKICVKCGHSCDEHDSYCSECGAPLFNFCSSDHCVNSYEPDHPGRLELTAKYCPDCGAPTTLYLDGYLCDQDDKPLPVKSDYLS